jgi:hypothetical protein
MRLSAASEGQVVRNTGNGSFYRFEREERSRARIRPLEHFPNGRLIPKTTDTLVPPDIEVVVIGFWREEMVVEGGPVHTRSHYEDELREREATLIWLEAEYEKLPVNGTGKQSRGSWANKVKNCRARIAVLHAGLGETDGQQIDAVQPEAQGSNLTPRDLVQLPSGHPALILALDAGNAMVRTRHGSSRLVAPIPIDCLRPWASAYLATI